VILGCKVKLRDIKTAQTFGLVDSNEHENETGQGLVFEQCNDLRARASVAKLCARKEGISSYVTFSQQAASVFVFHYSTVTCTLCACDVCASELLKRIL
jgi:hypothetical protein